MKMKNQIESIREKIEKYEYEKAISLIEAGLAILDKNNETKDESEYAELLSLRVTAKTLLGRNDDTILDYVRRQKIAHIQNYTIDKKYTITLYEKNLFLTEADAYINTIHVDKLFDLPQRSASYEFQQRLGSDEIQKQVARYKSLKLGDVVELHHAGSLLAPISFHIVCYEGENQVNLEALFEGLRYVLEEITRRQYKMVATVPLGYSLRTLWSEEKQKFWNPQIADKVAECIVGYLFEKQRNTFPQLQFSFMSNNSLLNFDRAFYLWSGYGKEQFRLRQKLGERQRKLIEMVRTTDPAYVAILKNIANAVDEDSNLLILGETGVGKSYISEQVHKHSYRASLPFKSVNCSYVKPDHLFTHLFGWKKGSFTSADKDGEGLIEAAKGGTLFMDEIGFADLDVQRGLFTFLDKGIFNRFGDTEERKSNVRLIFGTNQNLGELIKKGLFAPEFYERIAGREFEIPALRHRKEDIPLLAKSILDDLCQLMELPVGIGEGVLKRLKEYNWPGNIRQLRSYVQNKYHNCRNQGEPVITLEMILKDPPRDNLYQKEFGLRELETIIEQMLKQWEREDGAFISEFLSPVVAKVYLDNLHRKKQDASQTIGLDGSRGEDSTLMKKYHQYFNILKGTQ